LGSQLDDLSVDGVGARVSGGEKNKVENTTYEKRRVERP